MRLYKNNSGITLIELIISIAIAAIVFSMIAFMINAASINFKHTNEDVNLQMEAQITLNQLSTYIMEATDIKRGGVDAGDVSVAGDDVKYKLENKSEGVTSYYVIYFVEMKNRLYLIYLNTKAEADAFNQDDVLTGEDQYLMAEYVDGITIDYTGGEIAKVEIDFKLGNQTYTAKKNIKLRNVK